MSSQSTLALVTEHDWELRARRLRGHVDAVVELAGSLDAHRNIPRVLEQVCEAVDGSRAMLLRIDGDDVVIEGLHDIDGETAVPDWRRRLQSQPLLRSAHQSGEVAVGGSTDDAGFPAQLSAAAGVSHTLVLPLHSGEGVDGFLVVLRRHGRPFVLDDAASLRQLGNVALLALRNARLYTAAQTASAEMSQFLNLVAHDIRAPLTVAAGYLDMLREGTYGRPPAAWLKPMDLVTVKLRELHRLVDDILLAARLEGGGAAPMPAEVIDLNDAILRAGARSQARAAICGANVQTVPASEPVAAFAVGFHVDRILDNLVNNAISYGGAAPSVRISVDDSQPPAVRVEDHGVGIPADLHERIFERFFRLENPVPGTGFGLYVGWVLAQECGGSLHVERSAPGRGSVFRLELPAAPSTAA